VARVHELDTALLEGLWGQFETASVARGGLLLSLPEAGAAMPSTAPMPRLPAFCQRDQGRTDYGTADLRQGFTLELWLRLNSLAAGQVVLDSRRRVAVGCACRRPPRVHWSWR